MAQRHYVALQRKYAQWKVNTFKFKLFQKAHSPLVQIGRENKQFFSHRKLSSKTYISKALFTYEDQRKIQVQ